MNKTTTKLLWTIGLPLIALLIVAVLWWGVRDRQVDITASTGDLEIQTWQTDNGARVFFVQAPELPMVDMRVVFDAGSARDGDLPGLAQMTAAMLNLGAGEWDTNALAERFDSIGAVYGASVARDMAAFSLRTLVDKPLLDKAVETFATILAEPQFPEDELQRISKTALISLQNKRQSPGDIADDLFYKALYGEHPYASPVEGTEQSIRDINREHLQAFYQKYLVGNNAIIAIVGQVSRKQAEKLAERVIKKLPKGQTAPALPEVPESKQANTIRQPHPSTQTHILVGQPGSRRNDRDYFTLYVGNHILGGSGFGSRIMETIREQRGLAYSSYSYFLPQRVQGPFIMGLQTSNHQADEALKLLREVLVKFIDKGPTEEELQHAKKNITGGFPLRIDSNRDIVEYIAMIGFYDLPLDYLKTFNDQVNAVSVAMIRDAFQRRIDPEKLVTVMVGNSDAQPEP